MDGRRFLTSLGILKEGDTAPPALITALALLFPLGIAAATYFNFMTDGFALDDYILLDRVTDVGALTTLHHAFALPQSSPFGGAPFFWRPLGMLYLFAANMIFGLDATPYHIINLLLHGLNAALLVILVAMLTRSSTAGMISGALFAVMPTYEIGVTWISQVFELLGASFLLTCMILFTAYLRTGRTSRLLYSSALLSAVLALMSKESAVFILPMLAPLSFLVQGPRAAWQTRRRTTAELAPFGILAAAFVLFIFFQEYRTARGDPSYRLGAHVLDNLWTYLRWMTFPFPNTWGPWVRTAAHVTAALFLAGAGVAVVLRRGLALFLAVWMLFALLPFVQFTAGVELRYTYLASFPLAALLALSIAAFHRLVGRASLPTAHVFTAVGLYCLVLLFSVQTRDHQGWLQNQASEFQTLLRDVDSDCGYLKTEGQILVLNSPIFDPYGDRIQAAVNLSHQGISVYRVEGVLPPMSGSDGDKCVLLYVEGRYQAITPSH